MAVRLKAYSYAWCVACGCRCFAEFIKILRRITIAGTIKMGNIKSKWNEVMKIYIFYQKEKNNKGKKFFFIATTSNSPLSGKKGAASAEWNGNIRMLKVFILYTYLQFPAFFYTS